MEPQRLFDHLRGFRELGSTTREGWTRVGLPDGSTLETPTFTNELWTSKQRAAHSLHEISYRACFKPQLPGFFIERLTRPGDAVYDPFAGRGTSLLEAALRGRVPLGCDVSPLSEVLLWPRLEPPLPSEIADRLRRLQLGAGPDPPSELLAFYHPETLREICALRDYLLCRSAEEKLDAVDRWLRMVAVNRLTGHSSGFFSVYTLPPNQAVSARSQLKINDRRGQVPPRRDVRAILLKKSRSLLRDLRPHERDLLGVAARRGRLLTRDSVSTPELEDASVALAVTSPPFLDVVDYAADNWLRCWFIGVEAARVPVTVVASVAAWQERMTALFLELGRVLRPGGYVAFEVGEVRAGRLRLEEAVLPCVVRAGLQPVLVLIQQQAFTKTANCWGVANNTKGTNSNRIVLARRTS
jgi:hypothetical protein